jgi:hypothetical protein
MVVPVQVRPSAPTKTLSLIISLISQQYTNLSLYIPVTIPVTEV